MENCYESIAKQNRKNAGNSKAMMAELRIATDSQKEIAARIRRCMEEWQRLSAQFQENLYEMGRRKEEKTTEQDRAGPSHERPGDKRSHHCFDISLTGKHKYETMLNDDKSSIELSGITGDDRAPRGGELERLRALKDDRTPGHEKDCRKRTEEGLRIIEACTSKIEQAEAAPSSASDLTVVLEGQLRAFTSMVGETTSGGSPGFLAQEETWKDEYAPVTLETSADSEESETDRAGEEDAMNVHTLTRTEDNHADPLQNIRFSALSSIKRVVAYVMRFIRIVDNHVNTRRTASIKLTAAWKEGVGGQSTTIHGWEMSMSNVMLVKQHQISHLSNEIRKSLYRLNLYEDQHGVWRCRGRLGKRELADSAKFPMLVLQKSWLAQKIIEDCHSALHLSTSHTMCKVRETY
ncbi:hypothetical protein GCK32_013846 [Trichostrongylus colubriformis]|uniref:Uncharacterized protein n=1 Tax=Trichostrongylus colubriformis TaxID=6319 RepID=A0AAN8FH67_TRICO